MYRTQRAFRPLGTIGTDSVGAFSSVWQYDVGRGDVERWYPPDRVKIIPVTDPPTYDGNCITSIAAGGGGIWVTLASAQQLRLRPLLRLSRASVHPQRPHPRFGLQVLPTRKEQ